MSSFLVRAAITVKVHQSLANCFESYQCRPHQQMALEHSASLTLPLYFDHGGAQVGYLR